MSAELNVKPTTGNPKLDVAITILRYLVVMALTWVAAHVASNLLCGILLFAALLLVAYGSLKMSGYSKLLAAATEVMVDLHGKIGELEVEAAAVAKRLELEAQAGVVKIEGVLRTGVEDHIIAEVKKIV